MEKDNWSWYYFDGKKLIEIYRGCPVVDEFERNNNVVYSLPMKYLEKTSSRTFAIDELKKEISDYDYLFFFDKYLKEYSGGQWIKKEVDVKYKVGDKVRIKTWKEMEKEFTVNPEGEILFGGASFVHDMKKYCGKIMTIARIERSGDYSGYHMKEDKKYWWWTDKMIKGLVTKRATFYCERVVKDGEERIKINGWENVLEDSELPKEYFRGYPFFYSHADSNWISIQAVWGNVFGIKKGDCLTPQQWNKLSLHLQQAGKRLSKILKEKKWSGRFEVRI